MGTTRTDLHPDHVLELAAFLQALGHPARLRILDLIIERNECIGNMLVDELGLSQTTVHQHLKRLKDVGLIQGSIEGNRVCYCVDPAMLNELKESLDRFLNRPIKSQKC
ncbi:MAG: transcriptional regulator [Spirochaetaceae bacterium]|nr:transcriptional regulator [Spirochaetaceae bacterium]|tara:strand:- start:17010 stop:17336 length:327 start_codon:yes stop_codon:yes gene_type:complete